MSIVQNGEQFADESFVCAHSNHSGYICEDSVLLRHSEDNMDVESCFRAIDAIGETYKVSKRKLAILLVPRLGGLARKSYNAESDNVRLPYDDLKCMMCELFGYRVRTKLNL